MNLRGKEYYEKELTTFRIIKLPVIQNNIPLLNFINNKGVKIPTDKMNYNEI